MVVVSDVKKSFKDNPLVWVGLIIIAASLAVLAVVMTYKLGYKEEGLIAVVGDTKIYEKDLNEQIYGIDFQGSASNPVAVDGKVKKELLDKLVEWEIVGKEAEKAGISVSDKEAQDRAKELLGETYDNYSMYQRELTNMNVKNDLLLERLKDKVVSWREGKFFIARFDRAYEYDLNLNDINVQKKITEEKAYAEKLITDLYTQVKEGKISFDQAMETAENDPVIGKPSWGGENATYNFSETFYRKDSIYKTYNAFSSNFWNIVFQVRKGQYSKPQLIKVRDEKGEHDAFYAVIAVTDESESGYKSYSEWLEAMKKDYKVDYKVNY